MSNFVAVDSEKRVAEALGIPRNQAKRIRLEVMESGVDYMFPEKGCICEYSSSGIEKLMKALGVDNAPKSEDAAPVPKTTDGKSVRVVRICPNPTWVDCIEVLHPDSKKIPARVIVRVPNNRILRPGVVLNDVVHHPNELGEMGRLLWRGQLA